jgi:hypothetical protein
LVRPSLLVLGTAVALLGGGGVLAYANGWTTSTDSARFSVAATVTLPAVVGEKVAVPRITWQAVEITGGEPVHRYVVVRHGGRATGVVCTLAATRAPSCLDRAALPGDELTYTVTATHGAHWRSPDSEPSAPVTLPGPATAGPAPSGAPPVEPTVTGSPAVVPSAAEPPPERPPDTAAPAVSSTAFTVPAPTSQEPTGPAPATPEQAPGAPSPSPGGDAQAGSSETVRVPES